MKREIKCHPLMIFHFIAPVLFIPSFPVIKAVLEYFIVGSVKNFIVFEAVAIIVVILIGFLGLKNYRIEIEQKQITVKYGFIIRRKACLNKSNIAIFKTSQNIIDTVFRSATCEISTEAGRGKHSEFVFKLHLSDTVFLENELFPKENGKTFKFSLLKRIIAAASSSSFITGLIITIPIIRRADALFGGNTQEKLAENINQTAKSIRGLFPPMLNAAAIAVTVFFAVSFGVFFFRYILFASNESKETVSVKKGFFKRQKTMFKKNKIIAVETTQTLLLRILGLCNISASLGDFGKGKGEKGIVLPCISKDKAAAFASLFHSFNTGSEKLTPDRTPNAENRFLFKPLMFIMIVLLATVLLCIKLDSYRRFAISLLFVLMLLALCYANLCKNAFHQSYFGMNGEVVSAKGIEQLKLKELKCKREMIGEIKITRLPPDVWHDTCKVRITAHSKQTPTVKAIHLDYKKAKEMISKV